MRLGSQGSLFTSYAEGRNGIEQMRQGPAPGLPGTLYPTMSVSLSGLQCEKQTACIGHLCSPALTPYAEPEQDPNCSSLEHRVVLKLAAATPGKLQRAASDANFCSQCLFERHLRNTLDCSDFKPLSSGVVDE